MKSGYLEQQAPKLNAPLTDPNNGPLSLPGCVPSLSILRIHQTVKLPCSDPRIRGHPVCYVGVMSVSRFEIGWEPLSFLSLTAMVGDQLSEGKGVSRAQSLRAYFSPVANAVSERQSRRSGPGSVLVRATPGSWHCPLWENPCPFAPPLGIPIGPRFFAAEGFRTAETAIAGANTELRCIIVRQPDLVAQLIDLSICSSW